jgi:UDP-N-acetyl-2-amino-2-deoxyglucuronate dehydrogenase
MVKSNSFGLIGVGGYIVPRHLAAIKAVGGKLILAMDKIDNAGVLDSYFPETNFFSNFEEFIEFIYFYNWKNDPINYITICSPNYLHRTHISYALSNDMNAICEKPLALRYEDLQKLKELEDRTGKAVFSILQLRLHPAVQALKAKVEAGKKLSKHDIDLSYITFRGPWYYSSWKAKQELSGGVLMNLGIHFFDLLIWIFGKPLSFEMHVRSDSTYAGYLELERANVKWILSLDKRFLPENMIKKEKFTYRSMTIDGEEFEFSNVENDLHTEIYKDIIIKNQGFRISDVEESIKLVNNLTSKELAYDSKNAHQLLNKK